ncbi:hypothetical protein K1719_044384 [Acacia pycnantha]|nr:hypothetical protein K1719_044384 [Acacia pycnantha]
MGGLKKESEPSKPSNKGRAEQLSRKENDNKEKAPAVGSNLERRNKWEVQMDGKENLNPGECAHTTRRRPEGDISELRFGSSNVEQPDGICMSMEEGAASKGVVAAIRDFKFRYKVDMLVILEPRISVDVKIRDEQFLHCEVKLGGEAMLFTTIYASPNEQKRFRLWDNLQQLASGIFEPWLLAGDFNDIKTPLEQIGGGRVNDLQCRRFNEWIEDCKLLDIDAQGPLFTWKGPKWEGLERVYKRLDRCLCSTSCLEQKGWRPRLFMYEAMWKLHDYFDDVMLNSWQGNEETPAKLATLQQDLLKWNYEVFGQIVNRKRRLLNRL